MKRAIIFTLDSIIALSLLFPIILSFYATTTQTAYLFQAHHKLALHKLGENALQVMDIGGILNDSYVEDDPAIMEGNLSLLIPGFNSRIDLEIYNSDLTYNKTLSTSKSPSYDSEIVKIIGFVVLSNETFKFAIAELSVWR
jgi:hypothetical protein